MARDLTAGAIAQLQAGNVEPALLYEGQFASGYIRLWSGIGPLSWNGYTWTGVGTLGGISDVEETGEIKANGITVSLSGIPSDLIAAVLGDARHGKTGRVYLAFFSFGSVVADPALIFEGRLDVPSIDEGAESATISITYESELMDLERARERRWTPEDQAISYESDKGFDYVASLQDAQVVWGRS
jgi:hypothetical protein